MHRLILIAITTMIATPALASDWASTDWAAYYEEARNRPPIPTMAKLLAELNLGIEDPACTMLNDFEAPGDSKMIAAGPIEPGRLLDLYYDPNTTEWQAYQTQSLVKCKLFSGRQLLFVGHGVETGG